jgi:hypothetical protein
MEPRGTKNKFSAIVESIPQQTERPLIDINLPLTDNFPAIEELWTIKASGDEFLVGAGLLSDGLVVPLFLSEASAKETIQKLEDGSHIAVGMYAERLQSPIKAMRSAASQGAAGFQIQETAEDKNFDETIIQFSSGRILFPFLCRIEELSYPFPTVIGTALKCAEGVYLTSLGERSFDDFSLSQWINWKLMDRASAKMSIDQPFRSHNSGDSFWCLSTEKNTVGIYGNYGEDNE